MIRVGVRFDRTDIARPSSRHMKKGPQAFLARGPLFCIVVCKVRESLKVSAKPGRWSDLRGRMWFSLRITLLARSRHKSGRQLAVDPAGEDGENQPQHFDCVFTYYHNVAPKYPYYPAIGPSSFFSLVKLSPRHNARKRMACDRKRQYQ